MHVKVVPVRQLRDEKAILQVWEYAHGKDNRLVEAPQARKSIGAQVYYGVRLDGDADADKFLDDLAGDMTHILHLTSLDCLLCCKIISKAVRQIVLANQSC